MFSKTLIISKNKQRGGEVFIFHFVTNSSVIIETFDVYVPCLCFGLPCVICAVLNLACGRIISLNIKEINLESKNMNKDSAYNQW
jgi:hypothetical protein